MFFHAFKSEQDRNDFIAILKRMPEIFERVFASDNMIVIRHSWGFATEPNFRKAFDKYALDPLEKGIIWRMHTLTWAAHSALALDGDYVECGVYKGFCSGVMCEYLDWSKQDKRKLYLYDTFEGIPEQYNSENRSNETYKKDMEGNKDAIYEAAAEKFKHYKNVKLLRGVLPDTLQDSPKKIAFLHIDLNSAKAEIAVLEQLFDRLVTGGILLLDDYGAWGYRAQKSAEDDFMAKRGYQILELPTGQGLVIKR